MNKITVFLIFLVCITFSVTGEDIFTLDASMGGAISKISAEGDLKYIFEPTESVEPLFSYSFSLEGGLNLSKYFAIVSGFRFAQIGQSTEQRNVKFTVDQGIHTLSSKTELIYLSIPVNARLQFPIYSSCIGARFGPVVKQMISSRILWRLDNSDIDMKNNNYLINSYVQGVPVSNFSLNLLGGLEYMYRFSKNGVVLSVCHEWSLTSFASGGPGGDAYTHATYFEIGFRRYF